MVDGATRRHPNGPAPLQQPNNQPEQPEQPQPSNEQLPAPQSPQHPITTEQERTDAFATPDHPHNTNQTDPVLPSSVPQLTQPACDAGPNISFTNPMYSPRTIDRAIQHLQLSEDPVVVSESHPVSPRQHESDDRRRSNPRIRYNTNSSEPRAVSKTGTINLSLPYPAKFDPEKDNWLLWESSVQMFIDRIGLDRSILQQQHTDLFTPEEHSTVLGILTQVSPDTDGLWFIKLGFKWAHEAWDELCKAYGLRADITVQSKLLAFDSSAQRPNESIKNWVVRLHREVKEISLMSSETVPTSTHKIKLLRIQPTQGNELLFRNLLASLRTRLHLLTLTQLEEELINFEEGLNAEQNHHPAIPFPVNNMMLTGHNMSTSTQSFANRERATFTHKAGWEWRDIYIPPPIAQQYQIQTEDVCRICFQAKKPLSGCRHATNRCFELQSDFGRQVVAHIQKNPILDHQDPTRRVTPGI
jgi:hypothetical protein